MRKIYSLPANTESEDKLFASAWSCERRYYIENAAEYR
jgi:hypothetical protein